MLNLIKKEVIQPNVILFFYEQAVYFFFAMADNPKINFENAAADYSSM